MYTTKIKSDKMKKEIKLRDSEKKILSYLTFDRPDGLMGDYYVTIPGIAERAGRSEAYVSYILRILISKRIVDYKIAYPYKNGKTASKTKKNCYYRIR